MQFCILSSSTSTKDAFGALFDDCFNNSTIAKKGPPDKNLFIVAGVDDFRNVELTFEVSGAERSLHCSLSWQTNQYNPHGSIKSTRRDNNEPVELKDDVPALLGVFMNVYRGSRARWTLTGLYPGGLVSGRFIRSFIVQGLSELQTSLNVENIPLTLFDHSSNRELYWLENASGKTYYEGEWNLRYDCLAG